MTGADTAHELKALALRMAAVVDVLESRSEASAAGMSGARTHLDEAVQRLGHRSTALLQEVATGVQSATRAAAEEALGPPAATLKTQVAAVLRSLQDSTRQLALEREAFGRQQRRALWIGAGHRRRCAGALRGRAVRPHRRLAAQGWQKRGIRGRRVSTTRCVRPRSRCCDQELPRTGT